MSKPYVHYAWHLSYFSGKTRSYLRYKGIPHVEKAIDLYTFAVRAPKRTGASVMPIVVTPEGEWLQDTSRIIDALERRFPDAPVVPTTPVQRFAAYLLELWGDEWWLPVAMYTRWWHPENYPLFLNDAGRGLLPGFPRILRDRAGAYAASKMRGHLPALGINVQQVPLMDRWTRDALDRLDAHFATTPYLFGTRPSLGDFGLIGPMYAHLGRDPWSKRELIDPRPHLRAWVDRLQQPQPASGEFLAGDQIPETLDRVIRAFMPEMLGLLQETLRETRSVMARLEPGRRLPRGFGEIEFPMAGGRYRRVAMPYMLWMVQRLLDQHRAMKPADQAAVRNWLQTLGGDTLLDQQIPRLRLQGLRLIPEPEKAAA